MPQNPPEGYPRVMPYLLYEDSDAALEFLVSAFGFTEKMRLTGDDGRINHAEVSIGDGVIMFGTPEGDYKNPNELGGRTGNIYVYVDDVDAHYEHAKQAGATIAREPEDQFYGDRNTSCTTRRDTSGTSGPTSATCPRTKCSQPG